jgi:hypothetical protein
VDDTGPSDELHGNAATRFAETRLEKVAVDVVAWTTTYRDPADGSFWVMDYPHSEVHGGGSPRLRRQQDLAPLRGHSGTLAQPSAPSPGSLLD